MIFIKCRKEEWSGVLCALGDYYEEDILITTEKNEPNLDTSDHCSKSCGAIISDKYIYMSKRLIKFLKVTENTKYLKDILTNQENSIFCYYIRREVQK